MIANAARPLAEAALRSYARIAPTERGGYRLARLVRRLRPAHRWRDEFWTPDGLRLRLDLGVYPDCCMAYGIYETTTVRLVQRLLRPGDRFVDAGANIGYIAMLAAKRVGPTGRVDAFEPEPHNRERLERHLAANGLADRVAVHALALSDRPGEATIHFYGDDPSSNHGSSSLFRDDRLRSEGTRVPTAALDDVLPPGPPPRLVKLDVEGAEPLVVAGMRRMLAGDRPPAIVGELNPGQSKVAGFETVEWVRRVLETQPRYRVRIVGVRLRPASMTDLAAAGQANVLLSVD